MAAGPGSVQFGAGRRSVSVAGDEDGISASIDVDQAFPAAVIDQFRIEAALSGQVSLHLLPVFRFRPCHGAVVFRRDLFQEVEGRTERAPGGMDNEVDCTDAGVCRRRQSRQQKLKRRTPARRDTARPCGLRG